MDKPVQLCPWQMLASVPGKAIKSLYEIILEKVFLNITSKPQIEFGFCQKMFVNVLVRSNYNHLCCTRQCAVSGEHLKHEGVL